MPDNNTFNWTIEELGNLLNSPQTSTGGIDQIQASANTGMQQFMNSPAYQFMYGNNTSTDPSQRFQNDAGTQLAIQQGMKPLLDNYAAQGLSQSGALAKALSDYSYNHYNDFRTQQGSLFNNYQNQLAGLTQMGTQNSGSQNAYNMGNTLTQLLGNANLATGQNLAQAFLGTGSNISSLLGNQGVLGASGYLNTAGVLNQNSLNGLSLMAQLAANQNAGQASAMGGQGAMGGGLF